MKNIIIIGLCVCLSSTYAALCNGPRYQCVNKIYCIDGRVDRSGSQGISRHSLVQTCRPNEVCCLYEEQEPKEEFCGGNNDCVAKVFCVNGVIDTSAGGGIIRHSGACSKEEVCCAHEKEKPKEEFCGGNNDCVPKAFCVDGVIDPSGANGIIRHSGACSKEEVCCAHEKETKAIPISCSQSNPLGPEIRGQAKLDEFPWVVQVYERLFTNGSTFNESLTVGSLVTPKVVLTTAYGVFNTSEEDLFVRAGARDFRNPISQYAVRGVEKKIIHDDFIYFSSYFDIAILILKDKFELNFHINTICLPHPSMNFVHSRCIVAGWGKRQITDKANSPILKKIHVRVLDRDYCQNRVRVSLKYNFFELHSSFTCAGGISGNTCIGDMGAPLMCSVGDSPKQYQLAGMLSFNTGCNERDAPGGYVDVLRVLPWITEMIRYYD